MKHKKVFFNSSKWLQAILCTGMVLLLQSNVFAQLVTNNNVLISNSAQITVKGDIQHNAGTVIANSGIIDFTGNWINNSGNNIFGVSTGTVIMNGNNQVIQGPDQTMFNNLSLLNGIKTLEQHATVGGNNAAPAGVLSCNNAVLDLNSRVLTVNNANGAAITTGTGYILSEDANNSSKVTWKIANITGIHTIPFGNSSGVQVPYSFNLTSGVAGDVTVSTYATIANNTPYPVTPTLVTHVRNAANIDNSANTADRFWQVDKTGNGTATYTFTYAPLENAANGNLNLRAQRWNTGNLGWDAALPGQLNPTVQSVLVPGVSVNGAWALSLATSPLPVELLFFNAKEKNNSTIVCNWSTASEINNDYFTLERSANGEDFETVAIIDGNGTTNLQHNYSFEDKNPYKGVSYYRLKQTDFNGDFTYSKVENVLITSKDLQYVVFPNPNAGTFQIKYNALENSNANYVLTDATGRTILEKELNNDSGIHSISIENAAAGIYFLNIRNSGSNYIVKIHVTH